MTGFSRILFATGVPRGIAGRIGFEAEIVIDIRIDAHSAVRPFGLDLVFDLKRSGVPVIEMQPYIPVTRVAARKSLLDPFGLCFVFEIQRRFFELLLNLIQPDLVGIKFIKITYAIYLVWITKRICNTFFIRNVCWKLCSKMEPVIHKECVRQLP